MEKDFCMGLLVGLLGGAIAAANSFKVRKAVKDGQEQIMNTLNKMNEQKEHEQNQAQEGQR